MSPAIVFSLEDVHVVRVAPRRYVIVYCDERQAQWSTANREGGRYMCGGLGDTSFRDVCSYAARYGTRYALKREAVALATEWRS